MDTAYSAEIINKFSNMKLRKEPEYGKLSPEQTLDVFEPLDNRPNSSFIPAVCNFQTARKMAQENLEHQPLPDAVMDIAFRKAQVAGSSNPGVALEVGPYATGVGCKNYKAGPTKCTKYRVYRPKTSGVVPKPLSASGMNEKMPKFKKRENACAMDLAIGWDYRTKRDPNYGIYLDGSKASVAPPIFEVVESPKELNLPNVVHSGGVFSNTLGEKDFFDRDIIRQHDDYTKNYNLANRCKCNDSAASKSTKSERLGNRHNISSNSEMDTRECADLPNLVDQRNKTAPSKRQPADQEVCVHSSAQRTPSEKQKDCKIPRMCHNSHQDEITYKVQHEFRCAFKAGIPQSNSSGTVASFDSGISNCYQKNNTKKLIIPKPRNPYIKKNYIIDTLAPPFAFWKKGSGYPDYWRLVSVYQHAYKPAEKRKYPLLKTVYQ
ncbi:uncharacterized protein LOC131693147 [Topomyia yanbarensis]|uniref:uncharacterized protein LOC131693147 n=1 Tax=Topomyia yanbarensis TaxID=2498891 RepID=UPI00273CD4EE|nr:uncharacterized protein LOC131693147 [Topomyia yanbarensis]XP_058836719.1 uncharacterized protein LOC131693147 [Topomyia yanbarensis]XP_058836720.1 uncharacterized protein LOC131693147 [Topomyia yanbarensis]